MPDLSNRLIRTVLFKRDGNRCAYCNDILSHKIATIDHVSPVSFGGSKGSFSNMVLSCGQCNEDKGNRLLLEYLRSRQVVFLINKRIRTALKTRFIPFYKNFKEKA